MASSNTDDRVAMVDASLGSERLREAVRILITELGENPTREGLVKTPDRVAKALQFLTSGYQQDLDTVINNALFTVDYSEMVIVKDIDFYSLCEHHLLPFFGLAHLAYIPSGKVAGISKLVRSMDILSRRPQVQERLTRQWADAVFTALSPQGLVVQVEAEHLCMSMRGVQKPGSQVVTTAIRGVFTDSSIDSKSLLSLIKR